MRRRRKNIMDTVPASPDISFDKKEREEFRKRVDEVIAKVETDVGSVHLFEPMSDVVRRRKINDEIRSEIAAALFTEYLLFREHASMRLSLIGQLEVLEDGGQSRQIEYNETEGFEELFFSSAEKMLKGIYAEVK